MERTSQIQLDLYPSDPKHTVWVKQYDTYTRFLQIQLTKDGANYVPENGVTFVFRCQRPDGIAVTEDSTTYVSALSRYLVTNQGSGVIQVEIDDDATAVPGRCLCDLCLVKNERVLSTEPFAMEVVGSPAPPDYP